MERTKNTDKRHLKHGPSGVFVIGSLETQFLSQYDPFILRRKRSCEDGFREISPCASGLSPSDPEKISQSLARIFARVNVASFLILHPISRCKRVNNLHRETLLWCYKWKALSGRDSFKTLSKTVSCTLRT